MNERETEQYAERESATVGPVSTSKTGIELISTSDGQAIRGTLEGPRAVLGPSRPNVGCVPLYLCVALLRT